MTEYLDNLPKNAKLIKNTLNWCTPDGTIYGQETRKVPNRWHTDIKTPVKNYGKFFKLAFTINQGYKYCVLKYIIDNEKYIMIETSDEVAIKNILKKL